MDHTEAIIELKKVINPTITKNLIALIDKKSKDKLQINDGGVNQNVRNVNGYHLNFATPTNLFYWNVIKKEIERVYALYKAKFPKMMSIKINQIDLLKYLPGGKYEVHTDHFTISPRHLSIIINLNEDYEGGDLIFTDQYEKEIKRYKLNEGSVVFFPSNFMYPHSIEPIKKGTRYSIVAWLQ
jgi:Rps23 Pro-64 3,4-dihydroxylase Tpa1-like proline 4-hydroxylase|tara:strand:- start:3721 stop:4269 length:549 start_codon:yes stop_codon:yes gene_type:complete